jgi:glycosidase
MKRIKPDMLLLAEASALDPWYYTNGFDVAYDWTKELGHWAWNDVFYDTPSIAESLDYALGADPWPGRVFHFLNNNDTGPRFVSTYDSDTTRVAAALLLTLPGVPCVYTGDEIGAQYDPYQDQFPIDWTDDHLKLRSWYTKLCHLRQGRPSLYAQEWTRVGVKPVRSGLYAYLRHGPGGKEPLLVLLNFARDIFDAELSVPSSFASIAGATTLYDILNGGQVTVRTGMRIHVGALQAMVLSPGAAV